jgi:hypothetical protein
LVLGVTIVVNIASGMVTIASGTLVIGRVEIILSIIV